MILWENIYKFEHVIFPHLVTTGAWLLMKSLGKLLIRGFPARLRMFLLQLTKISSWSWWSWLSLYWGWAWVKGVSHPQYWGEVFKDRNMKAEANKIVKSVWWQQPIIFSLTLGHYVSSQSSQACQDRSLLKAAVLLHPALWLRVWTVEPVSESVIPTPAPATCMALCHCVLI